MNFQTEIIGGGSRRDLDLELQLDGVTVTNSDDSWWQFDNVIHYVNPDDFSLDKIDVLFLIGHDV
jgi:hypothetical protein